MKILIVDDDPQIRETLSIAIEREGWVVIQASDGRAALRHAAREEPALIVLDVGLPGMDGLEICRKIRGNSDVPVIFLTARDDEIDRVLGLEMGADDYITKPFSPRELVARIRAILRRVHARVETVGASRHGELVIDPARHLCAVGDALVDLTGTEMVMLHSLMRNPAMVTTRGQLIEAVWGVGAPVAERTLDSHIRNLRAKLLAAGLPLAIETLHGVGLRMGRCER